MTTTWLPGARVRDLSSFVTNGPFRTFLGVILHVNVSEQGTSIDMWGPNNSASVTPNFQVFKDGSIDQMLPFFQQPWCQIDGNFNYAAIETAGMPNEPLTDAQMASIAKILRIYHDEHGLVLQVANHPGERGLGTHEMGGLAWGGHACPGTIRAAQRPHLLALAAGTATVDPLEEIMAWYASKDEFEKALRDNAGRGTWGEALDDGKGLKQPASSWLKQSRNLSDPQLVLDHIDAEIAKLNLAPPALAAMRLAVQQGVQAAFAKAAKP